MAIDCRLLTAVVPVAPRAVVPAADQGAGALLVRVAVALSLAAGAILIVVAALVVALPLPGIALGSAVAGPNQPEVDGAGKIAVLLTDSAPVLSIHAFGTNILYLIDMTM